MDTTLNTLKAHIEQQARDAALTGADLDAACNEGAARAAACVEEGQNIFLMDEGSMDRRQNAYAMGWNSQYGTAANRANWDAFRAARSSGGFADLKVALHCANTRKLARLRRYGSHSIKTFIKRNGSCNERDILMLLRECFPRRFR